MFQPVYNILQVVSLEKSRVALPGLHFLRYSPSSCVDFIAELQTVSAIFTAQFYPPV